jgi:hypothetical protein
MAGAIKKKQMNQHYKSVSEIPEHMVKKGSMLDEVRNLVEQNRIEVKHMLKGLNLKKIINFSERENDLEMMQNVRRNGGQGHGLVQMPPRERIDCYNQLYSKGKRTTNYHKSERMGPTTNNARFLSIDDEKPKITGRFIQKPKNTLPPKRFDRNQAWHSDAYSSSSEDAERMFKNLKGKPIPTDAIHLQKGLHADYLAPIDT